MIPVPGGVLVSTAAVISAVSLSVGCCLLAAAAAYAPATPVGSFLAASETMGGIGTALLAIAILKPAGYPGEPCIFGIPIWLVRRASGRQTARPSVIVVDAPASTLSTDL